MYIHKIKEIRRLSMSDLRNLCIAKNYYDYGTTEAYDKLLRNVHSIQNITTIDIERIALDIIEHSSGNLRLETVCYEVAEKCDVYFIQ